MGSHSRTRNFIKHPKNRFSDRTIAWLVLSNFLRPVPLPLKELPNYGGHSYATIRLVATKLRRQGALTDTNKVVWANDYVQKMHPPLEELPELPRNTVSPSTPYEDRKLILDDKVEKSLAKSTNQPQEVISEHFATMTPERAMVILTEWIESGQAGSQLPKFVDQVMSLYDRTAAGVAPPEPVSDPEIKSRLLALMDAVPSHITLDTIETWNESYRLRTSSPSTPQTSDSEAIQQEIGWPVELADPGNPSEPAPWANLGDTPA